MVLAVIAALGLAELPAGATPSPVTHAHLRCASAHLVEVVETYQLPVGTHAVWLTVTEHYDGLTLYIAKHERVEPGETQRAEGQVGQHHVKGVSVQWVAGGRTTRLQLPPISC